MAPNFFWSIEYLDAQKRVQTEVKHCVSSKVSAESSKENSYSVTMLNFLELIVSKPLHSNKQEITESLMQTSSNIRQISSKKTEKSTSFPTVYTYQEKLKEN